MSNITDSNMIDAIGISKENETELILSIFDHLDFADEYQHLMMLQEKLNSYVTFIEDGQYKQIYPNATIEKVIIQIHFKYSPTENCNKFIDKAVQPMLNEAFGNVFVNIVLDENCT